MITFAEILKMNSNNKSSGGRQATLLKEKTVSVKTLKNH